ncbi:MAG: aminotransferase class V-fold PLP-dependent enzyme [Gammaproteobacteria bacterium]|nr:aminotransferase class V-fold PLP-dependent enzyme [Gammaproteobacteria bacterium]
MFSNSLLAEVRDRFHHVDNCPYQGKRAFFENAGGSLTLKSVVEVNTHFAAIPDNQGRDNLASHELVRVIDKAREDMKLFMGVRDGLVFVGESGTELLFRLVRAAVLGAPPGGEVLGSTLEHPATVSAAKRWCEIGNKKYVSIPHNDDTASITPEDYKKYVTADTRVATIIQTSPVTGMGVDVKAVVEAIRAVSPDCYIIVDGIQHAAHGALDLAEYNIDAFVVSAYKVFSKHNYGVAWVAPRLSVLPHDKLDGTADSFWELGTRDTSAFATFSEVVNYLDWLGSQFTNSSDRRTRLIEAGKAMCDHEAGLVGAMCDGVDGQKGLRDMPKVFVIGGYDNPWREGLVSLVVEGVPSAEVVTALNQGGVRTHVRKNDYFSGNVLTPLELETCIRVSMCHYNSTEEVKTFLALMESIAA